LEVPEWTLCREENVNGKLRKQRNTEEGENYICRFIQSTGDSRVNKKVWGIGEKPHKKEM